MMTNDGATKLVREWRGRAADFMLPGPGKNSPTFSQVIIGLSDAPETVIHLKKVDPPSLSRGNIWKRGPHFFAIVFKGLGHHMDWAKVDMDVYSRSRPQ
jgi:hypothetical protein